MSEKVLATLSIKDLENTNRLFGFVFLFCLIVNFSFFLSRNSDDSEKIHFSDNQLKAVAVKVNLASIEMPKPKVQKPKKSLLKKRIKKQIEKKDIVKTKTSSNKIVAKNSGQQSIIAKYLTHVRDIINNEKVYPRMAKRLKHEGTVKVEITIASNGNILNLNYITKTSSALLNSAAENIFNQIKSFGTFPMELKRERVKVTVPIVFELL